MRIDRLGPNRQTHFYRASCRGRLSKRDGEAIIPAQILPTIVNLLVREIYDAPAETDEKVAVEALAALETGAAN